jgi:hypothetical protein
VAEQSDSRVYVGAVGLREISSSVRMTAINGIQYNLENVTKLWADIATLYGTRIHFVHNNTHGPRAVDGALAFWDRYVRENPNVIHALAEHWEQMYEEVGDEGYIYHLAHSHGALLTEQAAELVSSKVRSRMIVRTFGALQNPYQSDFADIKNIACVDDPIVRWLNWYEDRGDVVRLEGIVNPKSVEENHSLRGAPYWCYIRDYDSILFRRQFEGRLAKFLQWLGSFWTWHSEPEQL